jgi:hypothetical protein
MNVVSICDSSVPVYKFVISKDAFSYKSITRNCEVDSKNGLNKYLQHLGLVNLFCDYYFCCS